MSTKSHVTYKASWESLDSRPIPPWFSRAKFGIFIHWGIYSVPAWKGIESERYASYAEWYYSNVIGDDEKGGEKFHRRNFGEAFEYRDFAPLFKAELFEPGKWAELFKAAGARYVVLTSKHHDGYCLWPTDIPCKKGWNSGDTGPCRDLVGELTEAVRDAGMKMGLYYSIPEWETHRTDRRPGGTFIAPNLMKKHGLPEERYVEEILDPQLRELVVRYAPSLIFSDGGEWDYSEDYFRTKEFLAYLYNEAPNRDEVIVNDRWAKGMPGNHGDYYSSEYQDTDAIGPEYPWEENRGIGKSYGLNRAEELCDYNSPGELISELIDIVSRGGNLLLNVGPSADGRIPVYQEYVLREIGLWLEVHGEGIYDTEPCLWLDREKLPSGSSMTSRGEDLFLFLTTNPDGAILLDGVESIMKAELLGFDSAVVLEKDGTGIRICLPEPAFPETGPVYPRCIKLSGCKRR